MKMPKTNLGISTFWLIIILTILTRIPVLIFPKAIDDERIYSVVAIEMIHGGLPYLDAIERKPPLLFWTYETILRIGGDYNWYWLHFAGLLWVLMSMLGLYFIGKLLFDKSAGLIAALLYSIFVSWAHWRNLALNGEMLMNLPIIWGIYFTFKNSKRGRIPELLIAGALLCCGFLLKQPAAIMAVPMGLYLLSPYYRKNNNFSRITTVQHAFYLTFGYFTLLALVAFVLHLQGNLEEAYYWIFKNFKAPHGITDPVFWKRGILTALAYVGACGPLVVGSYWSIKLFFSKKNNFGAGKEAEFYALIGLTAAAIVGLACPGRFYLHYYLQLTPILCLLTAPFFANIWNEKEACSAWWLFKPVVLKNWLALTVAGFLISHSISIYENWGIGECGKYVKEHTKPDDKVFVWGQDAHAYLDAKRRPAARYVATYPLTGYVFGSPLTEDTSYDTSYRIVPGSWENLREDLMETMPVVIIDNEGCKPVPRYPMSEFPFIQRIVEDCFELEQAFPDGIVYRRKVDHCETVFLKTNNKKLQTSEK